MTSPLKHEAHSWTEIPLPRVFITSLLHSHLCQSAHTHIHTHIYTPAWTHATLLGTRRAARKSRNNNYSSLLFLSLPRQPHKTALQPSWPPQVQVNMPTQTLLVSVRRCVELLGHWVTRPGPFPWQKRFVLWVRCDWRHIQTSHTATCRAAATGRLEIEEEANEQKKGRDVGNC